MDSNADQIRYWNETAGPKWVANQALIDEQIAALGRLAMDRSGIARGERVVDVGCGCGATTVELAGRVGATGHVLGLDVSGPMLERAAETVQQARLANVALERADAQTHRFPAPDFDLLFSRFGVMFFADPAVAFANLRTALRPGGRLAFICWQALARNDWVSIPLAAAARHLALPPPPAPGAPGPFSLADPERIRDILARAGFVGVALEDLRETLTLGGAGGLEAAVRLLLEAVGPASAALRDADPALRPRVAAAVEDALRPFATAQGVRLGSAAWIVTARLA